ncbi:hypothetical protein BaRGS_00019767 [Batillaria attramentaria]|uniref:CUB domain-containing protein n=1 Tax=Batillaria attramentaria TaxID=370345 RepID=A0ABD0KNY4_9CAEN
METIILCLILTLQSLSFNEVEMGQTETVITKISDDLYHINPTLCEHGMDYPTIQMHTEGRIVANSTEANNSYILCTCDVSVSGSYINVIVEKFHVGNDDRVCNTSTISYISISDSSKGKGNSYSVKACAEPEVVVSEFTNRFRFDISLIDSTKFTSIVMRFVATEEKAIYMFSHTAVNPVMGYVTTFGFDGRTHYSHRTRACFELILPIEHLVMVSFPHFDIEESSYCEMDFVNLYNDNETVRIWKMCGSQDIPPQIYNTSITLHFFAGDERSGTGFKLIYTIHNVSDQPQQVSF